MTEERKTDFTMPIAHPDWIEDAMQRAIKAYQLALDGRIPSSIKGWMILVPTLRVLRGLYGSDLDAAIALRTRAIDTVAEQQEWEMRTSGAKEPQHG